MTTLILKKISKGHYINNSTNTTIEVIKGINCWYGKIILEKGLIYSNFLDEMVKDFEILYTTTDYTKKEVSQTLVSWIQKNL